MEKTLYNNSSTLNIAENKKKKLPKNGWIKPCFICSRQTFNSMDTKFIKPLIKIYLCKDCKLANSNQRYLEILLYTEYLFKLL